MTVYSFNLIDQPWIPCLTPKGLQVTLSLKETLKQSHKLQGIAADLPLETAAIYRLLIAILHSALRGPANASDWNSLWKIGSWDCPLLHTYLGVWHDRFDLFDDQQPFFQMKDDRVKPKSIISLALEMASGNNAVLFDHHTEEVPVHLTPAKAARVLISAQYFGLAGLSGLEQKFTDSPWSRGAIILVQDETLFHTLALNLIRYDDSHPQGIGKTEDDLPAWESEDPYIDRVIPNGYLDYLTWQNRKIQLLPEGNLSAPMVSQIKVAPALRLDSGILDPFKNYRKDEKYGFLFTRFTEERALWRDSSALFNVKSQGENRAPLNFSWVATLADRGYINKRQTLRFMALGMANKQAKIEFFRHEQLPLPLAYLEDTELLGRLENAITLATEVREKLWIAVNCMATLVVSPTSDGKKRNEINKITRDQAGQLYNYWSTDRLFWGTLEVPFFTLLAEIPDYSDVALVNWKGVLRLTAWRALEQAINQAGQTAHALKAAVRARSCLGHSLKELLTESIKENVAW